MILIADSGSTKTDWCLMAADRQVVGEWQTPGINPVHQTEEDIIRIVRSFHEVSVPAGNLEKVRQVAFYGAGCNEQHAPKVEAILRTVFPQAADIHGHSDLLAAARALCQHGAGIACILGTGSNSCLYDGERILQNTPALGYILGDEGSGAVLGRLFLNGIFKGTLPARLRNAYLAETELTLNDIITKVYRQPLANRFLASVSLFISGHLDEPSLRQLVKDNFLAFVTRNLLPYGRKDLPVGAVGSVAHAYQDLLREVLSEEGFRMGDIQKSPMAGLRRFH